MRSAAASPRLYFLRPSELARLILLGIAQAVVLIAWIVCVWQAVDQIATMRGDMRQPLPWLLLLVGLAIFQGLLRALEFGFCEKIGFGVVRRLRMQIYAHMVGMSQRQIQHRSRGSLLLRLTGDLTMLRTWISRGIGRGTIGAIVMVVGLGAVAWLSILMAVVAMLVLAAGAAASLTQGRRLRRATAVVRRRRSLLASNIDEQISNLAVVQSFGRIAGERSRLSHQNDRMTGALIREAWIRAAMRGISAGSGWLAVAATLAVGVYEVAEGYITLGMLVAIATCVRHLTGPARALGFAHDYWRRAFISRRKILDFQRSRSRPLESPFHQRLLIKRGGIVFDRISVPHSLFDVSGAIAAGQRVAIVGPSGAGKSTLLGLVARLIEPIAGEVLIDGTALAECSLESSLRNIGIVSTDLPLMRGTIRRNVTYRRPSASDEEAWSVLSACDLEDWVRNLPDGLDTWITESGRNLAAGERQRLSLARAIMGYPRILLLDEPTTNLDETSAAIFHETILRYPGTVLIATHSRAEVAIVDAVWRLKNGRLVDITTPNRFQSPGQGWDRRLTLQR